MDSAVLVALIAAVLAAVASFAAAGLSFWGGRQARRQVHEAQRMEQARLNSERFGKASEQMGSEAPVVRLAGVYAMAALADKWEERRQQCVDVLCGYLRLPSRNEMGEQQVRLTVVRSIHQRLLENASPGWHEMSIHLEGAHFPADTDFSGAQFGVHTSFDNAVFPGNVNFQRATFQEMVTFAGATFEGQAFFDGAHFEKSSDRRIWLQDVAAEFDGAVFKDNATFSYATIDGTADFTDTEFEQSASFSHATLGEARFRGTTFGSRLVRDPSSATAPDWMKTQSASFNETEFTIGADFRDSRLHWPIYLTTAETKSAPDDIGYHQQLTLPNGATSPLQVAIEANTAPFGSSPPGPTESSS